MSIWEKIVKSKFTKAPKNQQKLIKNYNKRLGKTKKISSLLFFYIIGKFYFLKIIQVREC